MNDEYYDYEEILEPVHTEEKEEEIKLPTIVQNWERVSVSYSRHNNIPAIITFYSLLGDLVKNFVEVPWGETSTDTRIHFCWIQTARSGKTTLIMYVLNPVAKRIYEELKDDPYISDATVLNFADYNTASLVGSHILNVDADGRSQFDSNAEQNYTDEVLRLTEADMHPDDRAMLLEVARNTLERTKDRWLIEKGPIDGQGVWIADEFEGSGVFKEKNHKENMNILFQTIMNNFHSGSHLYEKVLTGKPTIELDCKYTVIACTFPPEYLLKTVAEKGVLQRFLPFIWEVPDKILTQMRVDVLGGFGTVGERKGPPLQMTKGFLELYKLTKARFEHMGKDKTRTVTYHPSAKDAILLEHKVLLQEIAEVQPKIRNIIRLFEMNLCEYIGKIAVLNAIASAPDVPTHEKFIVAVKHVKQAAKVVRACYGTLVLWLENAIKIKQSTIITKNGGQEFQQAYKVALSRAKPHEKLEEGYVLKKLVIDEACKILKKSQRMIKYRFKNVESLFEEEKRGREVFIRLIQEE